MTRGNNGTTGDIVDSVSQLCKFKSTLPNYIFLFFFFFSISWARVFEWITSFSCSNDDKVETLLG